MINSMLTQNIDQLRQEVAAHVAADTIIQGDYWDNSTQSGCFIGCLAKSSDPMVNETTYGLPAMLQRIAESIFEALPADDAKAFFAALPKAIDCDGKDLTRIVWQFLAADLRSLSNCSAQIQAVINPVITGMDLLASGQEWNNAAADAAVANADAAAKAAQNAVVADATAYAAAANAAAVAKAARNAAYAAYATNAVAAAAKAAAKTAAKAAAKAAAAVANADAAACAADAAYAAAYTAVVATNAYADARLRQRDLLLKLISEAPVVKAH